MNKSIVWLSVILGLVCIGLAVLYWITPAGSLPAFLPGYAAGSATIHIKHGIGAVLLGLALFAFAWFQTGPKKGSAQKEQQGENTGGTAVQ